MFIRAKNTPLTSGWGLSRSQWEWSPSWHMSQFSTCFFLGGCLFLVFFCFCFVFALGFFFFFFACLIIWLHQKCYYFIWTPKVIIQIILQTNKRIGTFHLLCTACNIQLIFLDHVTCVHAGARENSWLLDDFWHLIHTIHVYNLPTSWKYVNIKKQEHLKMAYVLHLSKV